MPVMEKPDCYARPGEVIGSACTFFATVKTFMGQPLLQPDRNANLFIDVLRSCVADGKFELNDFVAMPDHVHLLITLRKGMTIERAMQLIKGGFSHRMRNEVGYAGEIWQPGFSEKRAPSGEAFLRYKGYIAQNPVKAGICSSCEEYPHSFAYLAKRVRAEI